MAVTLSQFVQYVKTLDLTPTDVMPQDGWIIYGDGNVLKRVNSNTIISSIIQAGFEVIDGTTVIPATGYRRYRVLEAGTYAGITVTQEEINNNWVYIVVDAGVSSKELEPKPDFGSTIRDWVNTEDGLVFPDVRLYDNKVFRVVEGETVIGTDIPGISLKWLLLIEDTSSLLVQVDENTSNIGDMSALAYGNVVEAINAALVASNGSLFLQNLIDVSIPSPVDGEVLTFNGSEWINKTITDALGYVPENTANKGASDGYAPLDATSKIDPIYLTGFIPEIIEGTYVDSTTFNDSGGTAVTPEAAKIYVDTTSSKAYRWGGTSFTEIQASPGTTDEVTEGSINKYFTEARVRATILSGISFVTETAINATDSILIGLGKLQAQISNHLGLTNNPHAVTAVQAGAETPAGAQTKAITAETNAKGYADTQDVATLQSAKDYADGLNDPTVDHTYLTVPAMLAAQNEQLMDDLIKVEDAGADSRITGKAYYFYNGTIAGTLEDYHLLSNSEIATLTGQAVIDALGYTPDKKRTRKEVSATTQYTFVPEDFTDFYLDFTADGGQTIQGILNAGVMPDNGQAQIISSGNNFIVPTAGTGITFIKPPETNLKTVGKGSWLGIIETTTADTLSINGSLESTAAGGGGIADAPSDGTPYSRQDADWVAAIGTTYSPFTNSEDGLVPAPNISGTTTYSGAITSPAEGFTITEGVLITVTASESSTTASGIAKVLENTGWVVKDLRLANLAADLNTAEQDGIKTKLDILSAKRELKIITANADYIAVLGDEKKFLVFDGGTFKIPNNIFSEGDIFLGVNNTVSTMDVLSQDLLNSLPGYNLLVTPKGDYKKLKKGGSFKVTTLSGTGGFMDGSFIKEFETFQSPNGTIYKVGVDDTGARTSIAL